MGISEIILASCVASAERYLNILNEYPDFIGLIIGICFQKIKSKLEFDPWPVLTETNSNHLIYKIGNHLTGLMLKMWHFT